MREAILMGNARAIASFFDKLRANGWTYAQSCDVVRLIFEGAGREHPSEAWIDAKLREVDEGW